MNVNTIILNENLTKLSSNAINNCEKLKDIYLFTNIIDINNTSIVSNSIRNLHINSTLYAYNDFLRDRDIIGQMQLLETMTNRVVFFGPSVTRFNHPLDELIKKFPNRSFFLSGLMGGGNQRLGFDLILNILNKDDYIFPTMYETVVPPSAGGGTTFVFLKYDFDVLLSVNYQYYKDYLLNQFRQFVNDFIINQGEGIYTNQRFSGYNTYGMVTWNSDPAEEGNLDPSYQVKLSEYLNVSNFNYYEELVDKYSFPKDHVMLLWSTYNKNSVNDEDIIQFEQYEKFVLDTIHFDEFEHIKDNIIDGMLFRKDDSIHLSLEGGKLRVAKWIKTFEELNLFDN